MLGAVKPGRPLALVLASTLAFAAGACTRPEGAARPAAERSALGMSAPRAPRIPIRTARLELFVIR
jgi:hypothetical protein